MFVGKLTVFTAAVDADLAWLAVVAVLNTMISVVYYLRWIAPVFRRSDAVVTSGGPASHVLDRAPRATVAAACAAASLLLGVGSGPVLAVPGAS